MHTKFEIKAVIDLFGKFRLWASGEFVSWQGLRKIKQAGEI